MDNVELNPDAFLNVVLIGISVVTFIILIFVVWIIWYCRQKRLPTQFLINQGLGRRERLVTVDLFGKPVVADPPPEPRTRRPSIFTRPFTVHDIFKVVDKKTRKDGLQISKEPVVVHHVDDQEDDTYDSKFDVISKPIAEEPASKATPQATETEKGGDDDVFLADKALPNRPKFMRQSSVNIDKAPGQLNETKLVMPPSIPASAQQPKDRRTSKLSNFNRVRVTPPPTDVNPKVFKRTASEDALNEIKALMNKRKSPRPSPLPSISNSLSSPALVLQESKRYSPSGIPMLSDAPPYSPTGETLKYPIPRRVFPSLPQNGTNPYALSYNDPIKQMDLMDSNNKPKPVPRPRPVPAPRKTKPKVQGTDRESFMSTSSTDGSDRSTPTAVLVPKDKAKEQPKGDLV